MRDVQYRSRVTSLFLARFPRATRVSRSTARGSCQTCTWVAVVLRARRQNRTRAPRAARAQRARAHVQRTIRIFTFTWSHLCQDWTKSFVSRVEPSLEHQTQLRQDVEMTYRQAVTQSVGRIPTHALVLFEDDDTYATVPANRILEPSDPTLFQNGGSCQVKWTGKKVYTAMLIATG